MCYKYYSSPYLEHHGIKGQKWGVRRFQNSDGSYTNAGRKRYGSLSSKAKKMVDTLNDYSSNDAYFRKRDLALQNFYKTHKKPEKYYDENWQLTEEAKKYEADRKKFNEEWEEKHTKVLRKRYDAVAKLRNEIFQDERIKQDVDNLKTLKKQIDIIEHETISENSPFADKAYKKYLKENKDKDFLEYGFYHYTWRDGNEDYDAAYKIYEQKVAKYEKDYWNGVRDLGKRICDGMKDVEESSYNYKYYKSYVEDQLHNHYFGNTLYRK